MTSKTDARTMFSSRCDAVVITGDIGESPNVAAYLRELEQGLQRPIYFVLGNHDFDRGDT